MIELLWKVFKIKTHWISFLASHNENWIEESLWASIILIGHMENTPCNKGQKGGKYSSMETQNWTIENLAGGGILQERKQACSLTTDAFSSKFLETASHTFCQQQQKLDLDHLSKVPVCYRTWHDMARKPSMVQKGTRQWQMPVVANMLLKLNTTVHFSLLPGKSPFWQMRSKIASL